MARVTQADSEGSRSPSRLGPSGTSGSSSAGSARGSSPSSAVSSRRISTRESTTTGPSRASSSNSRARRSGPVIGRIRQGIRTGSTLEEAMSREPQVFSPMFLSMIRVAEARGGVPETLRMMGNHYESRQRLIRQARSAMIYPVIVLIMAGGVIALITIWLLPMFASMLTDISRKAQLPWASQALLAFSGFIRWVGWWLLPALMVGIPFLLLRLYKTAAGKAVMDRVILFTPVFGSLFRKLDTSRFARTLSTLLDAGVDVGTSIDLTAGVVSMTPIRNAIQDSRDQVMQGKELSVALASSGQFYPDVLAVLASGEETGKIPESLNHLADDYEEQVTLMVKNMGHLIQPLLVLILGGDRPVHHPGRVLALHPDPDLAVGAGDGCAPRGSWCRDPGPVPTVHPPRVSRGDVDAPAAVPGVAVPPLGLDLGDVVPDDPIPAAEDRSVRGDLGEPRPERRGVLVPDDHLVAVDTVLADPVDPRPLEPAGPRMDGALDLGTGVVLVHQQPQNPCALRAGQRRRLERAQPRAAPGFARHAGHTRSSGPRRP